MNRIAVLSSNLSFNWQSYDKVLCSETESQVIKYISDV